MFTHVYCCEQHDRLSETFKHGVLQRPASAPNIVQYVCVGEIVTAVRSSPFSNRYELF
jgi:hypothetical protein